MKHSVKSFANETLRLKFWYFAVKANILEALVFGIFLRRLSLLCFYIPIIVIITICLTTTQMDIKNSGQNGTLSTTLKIEEYFFTKQEIAT